MKRFKAYSIGLLGLLVACGDEEKNEPKDYLTLPIGTTSHSSPSVTVADMNTDQRPDIVVALTPYVNSGYKTRVYILYNHGEGKYSLELPTK